MRRWGTEDIIIIPRKRVLKEKRVFDTIMLSLDPVEERKQAVVHGGCLSSQQGSELISLEGGLWDRDSDGTG